MFDSWITNLVFYLISVVIFNQAYKATLKNTKSDGSLTILLQLIAGVSILVLIPLHKITFATDPKLYILLFIALIFYALNDRLQTTARKNLEVCEISIIAQLSNVFVILYGITIFKEEIILTKIAGALFIILGNILILYRHKHFNFNRYSLLAVFTSLLFATALSIDVGISENFNLPIYISITLVVPALFILIGEKISINSIKEEYKQTNKKNIALTGIFWGLLIYFLLGAYQNGEVTTIAPLVATSVLLNVIVAFFVHKETHFKIQKILASILIIIGIYLTVI